MRRLIPRSCLDDENAALAGTGRPLSLTERLELGVWPRNGLFSAEFLVVAGQMVLWYRLNKRDGRMSFIEL